MSGQLLQRECIELFRPSRVALGGIPRKITPEQAAQALHIAAIPTDEFEVLVESPNPPTLTALAEIGKKYMQRASHNRNDTMLVTPSSGANQMPDSDERAKENSGLPALTPYPFIPQSPLHSVRRIW